MADTFFKDRRHHLPLTQDPGGIRTTAGRVVGASETTMVTCHIRGFL